MSEPKLTIVGATPEQFEAIKATTNEVMKATHGLSMDMSLRIAMQAHSTSPSNIRIKEHQVYQQLEDTIHAALNEVQETQQTPEAGVSARELAIVRTKLQEAMQWLRQAQGRI